MLSRQYDDEQLIVKSKNGDAEAFGELYERYAEVIFRYLYSHLESRLDAEDLTEDVFMRAWKALSKYDERGLPFSAFLFRSARNSLIDYYRQQKALQSIEDLDLHSNEPGPEELVSEQLSNADLRGALAGLREDYRSVIIFRFLSGLSPEETAQVMQRSIGAVRVLQHRALLALKEVLERGACG
jgi:RNA polymerase sigma-70 factor (ECF subfamily)